MKYWTLPILGFAVVLAWAGESAAQDIFSAPTAKFYVNRTKGQDAPRQTNVQSVVRNDVSRGTTGFGFGQSVARQASASYTPLAKPFENATNGPTVSPYLNLVRDDAFTDVNTDNYTTLVRPMMQQQQINRQQQLVNQRMSRQLQSIQAQGGLRPQGSEQMAPTGHQAVFQYYSHFYGRRR